MQHELFLGEHYILQLCGCDVSRLDNPEDIETSFLECAQMVNATVICTKFHHFEPYGVSGVVVISESHMTVHTWPEFKYAAVDVFTCSSKMESHQCLQFLARKFDSKVYSSKFIPRGFLRDLEVDPAEMEKYLEYFLRFSERGKWTENKQIQLVNDEWVSEKGQFSQLSIPYNAVLYEKNSQFQAVKIVDSPTMGRTLILDGVFMVCEKTEANYHEMMVHPALQILLRKGKNNLRVLIIGGGDGGAARELLRYPQVETIVVAELDGDVIESCKQFLPQTASSFSNERVSVRLGDGLAYVKQCCESWDLILCDGCDPVGQACNLFAESFYENCHKILAQDGIFLTQGESPMAYQDQFLKTHRHLSKQFGAKNTGFIFYHQPLYEFAYWAFQIAIKDPNTTDLKNFSQTQLNEENVQSFVQKQNLQYYNFDIHLASMALPTYVKRLLKANQCT